MKKSVFLWVLKSEKKTYKTIWREPCYGYFANRTSLKNPRFVANCHWQIKLFETRDEALEYYYAKVRKVYTAKDFRPIRKKIFIKAGHYDWWKNSEVFK